MKHRRKRGVLSDEASNRAARIVAEKVERAETESENNRKLDGYIEIMETSERMNWGRE